MNLCRYVRKSASTTMIGRVRVKMTRFKLAKRLLSILAAGSLASTTLLGVSVSASAASTPTGGTVNFYATPTGSGKGFPVILTGAIGDHGKASAKMDKDGKANKNGNYGTFTLQKGTIEANLTMFNAKTNSAQPTINTTTCSAQLAVTVPVLLFNGTGIYKGITGTLNLTETFAVVLPRFKSGKNKGKCNASPNAQVIDQWGSLTGSGTVSF